MKTKLNIYFLVFLLPMVLFANDMEGKYTKTKKVKREFKVSSNAFLDLANEYGSIDIKTWNENRIVIEVIIKTNSNSEKRAQERLDGISIHFENSKDLVAAKTDIEDASDWSIFGKNSNVNIDIKYRVRMPITNNLEVAMEYGNILLDELKGSTKIQCEYGKLLGGRLKNENNTIDLEYSKGSSIEYIKSGKIDIEYSSIDIEEAGEVLVNSDYSSVNFDDIGRLEMDSDYGNLSLKRGDEIFVQGDYVNYNLGTISESLSVECDYGNLKVAKMEKGFRFVRINSEYTGVKLGVASNSSFLFSGNVEYGGIHLPASFDFIMKSNEDYEKHYKGRYNGGKGGDIKINSEYGTIRVIEKE